jgi:hypothetical protein
MAGYCDDLASTADFLTASVARPSVTGRIQMSIRRQHDSFARLFDPLVPPVAFPSLYVLIHLSIGRQLVRASICAGNDAEK